MNYAFKRVLNSQIPYTCVQVLLLPKGNIELKGVYDVLYQISQQQIYKYILYPKVNEKYKNHLNE